MNLLIIFLSVLAVAASAAAVLLFRERRALSAMGAAYGKTSKRPEPPAEMVRAEELYARVLKVMDADKPYLDENFSIEDLSHAVYSNKMYLSRTINDLSGKNFCQFVNTYRVQYGMDLIRKDPHIKVSEVAELSGFHSIPSFNMAFKVNTGITPSLWRQEYRDSLRL